MNAKNSHIDLIEKYLDKNLDVEECLIFNKKLESDEEFVRELNDMELLIKGIKKSAAHTTVEEKLDRFETSMKLMKDEEEKDNSKIIFFDFNQIKKYSWAIAASLTLIMVTSISLFNISQPPSSQKLYASYYTPFENFGNKRGPEIAEKNYWKKALAYYDVGDYDNALINFNKIIIADFKGTIKDPSFRLYKGNTLMMLNRYDDAKRIFQSMLDDDDGMIIQAKWYLSMCYLHENNTEKLIPLLNGISEIQSSSYSAKAQEILKEIN